jgi:hypothetical protein
MELCKAFWKLDDGTLDGWITMIRSGRAPEFSNIERFQ